MELCTGGGDVTLTLTGLPEGESATVTCDNGIPVTAGSDGTWTATLPNETRTDLFTAAYGGRDNYEATTTVDATQRADLSGFGDADAISDYAQAALFWANAQGLVLGFEDGSLQPQGTASRAQIAAVLLRFCETVVE